MSGWRCCALILLFLVFSATAGCKKETPPPPAGSIKATAAYLDSFGDPPTPEKGECFARVAYLPRRSDPGRVSPLPLFLFTEKNQLQEILSHLVGGQFRLPAESGLFNPFPAGTQLLVQGWEEDRVTLNLLFGEPPGVEDISAIVAALTETATQFESIHRVIILRNGELLPGAPADGFRHDSGRIAALEPPLLFMVVGSWENGGEGPHEILANFDRPVEVHAFRLEDADGREIKGEYFQSVFDMSVVLHPENPSALREGMALRAQWDVTDYRGRRGQGEGTFRLQRHEHP